jgi:hypothetical protein
MDHGVRFASVVFDWSNVPILHLHTKCILAHILVLIFQLQ